MNSVRIDFATFHPMALLALEVVARKMQRRQAVTSKSVIVDRQKKDGSVATLTTDPLAEGERR